jgi:ABC-2 type transport system permease protein
MMNNHIPTLLLREWMQHKRGWLIAAFAPPLLFLAMLPFGHVQGLPTEHMELMALGMLLLSACTVYAICLLFALFQLPGLARRDAQDRSIEFWLSLPGRPSESVASTVLAHAWLAPLGGAIVGALFGIPIAMSVLGSKAGLGTALSLNWGEVISAALPLLLRGLAGTVPLLLWLAPMIFVLMAASAWLKRLGVPLVFVGSFVVTLVLHKVYSIDWPLEVLGAWNERINHTLINDEQGIKSVLMASDVNLWSWSLQDLGHTLAELASLQFLGWTAVAAAGFALVVMKRARGA